MTVVEMSDFKNKTYLDTIQAITDLVKSGKLDGIVWTAIIKAPEDGSPHNINIVTGWAEVNQPFAMIGAVRILEDQLLDFCDSTDGTPDIYLDKA